MIGKGKITAFAGSWGSGLAAMCIEDERRGRVTVYCDNAQTVRALDSAFGGVIGAGHKVNMEAFKGQIIYYGVDDHLGCLDGFTSESEASAELVQLYEDQGRHEAGV